MKSITIKKDRIIAIVFVIFIFAATYSEYKKVAVEAFMPTTQKTIIIDAGHGGWTP